LAQRGTDDLRIELKIGQFETDENYLKGIPKPCVACSIHARGTIEIKFKSVCSGKHCATNLSRLNKH
jgi:hypothetical protein